MTLKKLRTPLEKLTIHSTSKSEIDLIIAIENNTENSQFIFPNSKTEHIGLISNNDFAHLTLKTNVNNIVGYVILAGLENRNRSIELRRIVINQKGKGFGRKTIKQIRKRCFKEHNCHRLWLDVLETNERARQLYKSEGFVEEGILRESVWVDGKYVNLIVMSILESEYRATWKES
ncbi:GNAT family N-acetyltransferase [Euzebyella marina]|uniref:GNAT family N-acetyltransferase n=1 Tax=Euzebyella marina TaxID=1761453 RepID=UPI0013CF2FF4|nr:GNAT family protein [Euzebyella marina]